MTKAPFSLWPDDELVTAVQKGEADAFTALMERHKAKALQLAWAKTGNWEDAKDIAQEAFVKAYHALPEFHGRSKFSTWLYTLVINTARDYWRKKHPLRWLTWSEQKDMDFFFETQASPSAGPQQALESEETSAEIARIAGTLPERQRLIFTLRFFQESSLAEIAEILGISEGTVKAGLHFALQKFKTAFKKDLGSQGGLYAIGS